MWLHIPTEFLPSAPASEDLNSASESPAQMLARSATSRGKSLPPRGWQRVCKMEAFTTLLSGLTSPPSILNHGADLWIASLREIPVSRIPSLENSSGEMMTDGYSTTSSTSSKSCGLLVSSERTCRGTRTGSLKPSSQHWKEWVTALRLEYSQRPRSAPRTDESGCSSWPTAKVASGAYSYSRGDHSKPVLNLEGAANLWETPSVAVTEGTRLTRGGTRAGEMLLSGQALATSSGLWTTPVASDMGRTTKYQQGGTALSAQAVWPTPTALDRPRSPETMQKCADFRKRNANQNTVPLYLGEVAMQVSARPTPAARDYKGSTSETYEARGGGKKGEALPAYVDHKFSPPLQIPPHGQKSSDPRRLALRLYLTLMSPKPASFKKLRAWVSRVTRRKLNPCFVDWMQGWPSGWTVLDQPVMGFAVWLRHMRGELSKLALRNDEGWF